MNRLKSTTFLILLGSLGLTLAAGCQSHTDVASAADAVGTAKVETETLEQRKKEVEDNSHMPQVARDAILRRMAGQAHVPPANGAAGAPSK